MGKASSNKKIARAQRAGGTGASAGRQSSLLFPVSVVLVVVLGLALVVVARSGRDAEATGPPTLQDHWHAAYEVNICGEPQPAITDDNDPAGIHTHGDGVIHIHPFSENTAGENANLQDFLDAASLEVSNDRITVPGGSEVTAGEDQCDGVDAVVRVARWESADAIDTTDPQIFTEDFGDIRFLDDREAITIFFGPADADIPPPSTIGQLDQLTDVPDPTQQLDPESSVPIGPEGLDGIPGTEDDGTGEPSDTSTTDPSTTDGE